MASPRVFISYAHDSDDHQEAVRDLWILLRGCGIDARLDLPAAERRQDWPLWMLEQIRETDYVLVIASPAYRLRAEGTAAADEGRGVQFEAALLREELYRHRDAGMGKLLPVVLPGQSADNIPAYLGPTTATPLPGDRADPGGVERLLRVLTNQPLEVEPPLGQIPTLPSRPVGPVAPLRPAPVLAHELVLDVVVDGGQVRCRAELAGTVLADRSAAIPFGLDGVWEALGGPAAVAEQRLVEAGHRLRQALLDEPTVRHLTDLLDHSPLGTVVELVIWADGPALGLPYELLRLPDGRLLATVAGVWMRRRVRGWTDLRPRRSRGC